MNLKGIELVQEKIEEFEKSDDPLARILIMLFKEHIKIEKRLTSLEAANK